MEDGGRGTALVVGRPRSLTWERSSLSRSLQYSTYLAYPLLPRPSSPLFLFFRNKPCSTYPPFVFRFMGSRNFMANHNICDAEHIGKATVCRAVRKVTLALKRLLPVMVVFPGHKPVRNIKEEFHRIADHSDAAYIVTNVEAKWPGSVHDSRIYRECRLSNRFARGEFDGYLLGEHGYPCQPSLLTPYPDPEPGSQQHFNVAHCRTRARVEMTIGILKSRFQCLQKLRVTPERACDIIVACVVPHNIAIIRGAQHPAVQINDPADDHPIPADVQDGRAARDLIARNYF
ncbi:putative nuclease HARBI1 [Merluccius polli]|uniref:Nuclease HARBI1 n=1 Tax=Merluccius polli TaxID=89951 RepID=A0AA47MWG8_MERPO|nr:putative nuclease HARBI1 [Merluccius polli]